MDRNKGHYRKNVADDIATVQTMLCGFHDHPFMQEIVQIKGKPASVILYLEDNLKEIQQFCTRVQITRALHWDSLYTTYHRFFSHLQSKLTVYLYLYVYVNIIIIFTPLYIVGWSPYSSSVSTTIN